MTPRTDFADLVIDTVKDHAPNFKASVLARQVLSPLDLERRFGLPDGDIFHGQLSLDQLYQRPAGARPCRLPHAAARTSTCAVPAPIPAAASQACPAATLRLKSFEISRGRPGCAGADPSISWREYPILRSVRKHRRTTR